MNPVNSGQRPVVLSGGRRAVCARVFTALIGAVILTTFSMYSPPVLSATNDAEWKRLLREEEERHQERWDFLRDSYFDGQVVGSAKGILEIKAPIVPADPAVVPVSIRALQPQTAERYIKKITLLVDHNPSPLAAVFHLSERNGVADLATRVRVGEFSHVRAVAEFNDGQLVMASKFVKASGGCDVAPFEDSAAVEKRLGKMKLRLPGGTGSSSSQLAGARFADLLIEHPNYNGMQRSDTPGVMIPLRTLDHVEVTYDGKPLMRIEGHLSLSHNPKFRFHYLQEEKAEANSGADTSNSGAGFSVRLLDSANTAFERSWPASSSQ